MKFKKYIKESEVTETKFNLSEDFGNPDQPLFAAKDYVDSFYAPVKKLLDDKKFDEAKKEIEALEADLDAFEQENSRKRFFKFPKFMIENERKRLEQLKAQIPVVESLDDMEKRCENCNTLLNDQGTCPKCDDGEEDYGDVVVEELSAREKLKAAYPELNFDASTKDEVTEEIVNDAETETIVEEVITEETVVEELSNKEKLLKAFPELNFDKTPVEEGCSTADATVEESVEDTFDYDDDYEVDDVEEDRAHAALYGGDRMYCDCGKKLSYNEYGSYCPECDAEAAHDYNHSSDDCCAEDEFDDTF